HWIVLYSGRLSEDSDIDFAERLKALTHAEVVIVGPYASINPTKTISKAKTIKYLITGEFEHPVAELIEGKAIKEIDNLVYKDADTIIENNQRPYLNTAQLDAIPFVSEFFNSQLNIYKYRTPSEPYPFIDILTGRGCRWGRCTYCLWVHTYVKGPTYNTRSIDNVIEEFNFISRHIPEVKSVMIQDDTLTAQRAREFCSAKLASGNKLRWSCYARANLDIDTLRLMKEAGCLNLHVGYETADNEILRGIKKGLTVEQMTKFTEDAKKVGLRIHGDFAIGFPNENKETALKTIKWACKIRPHTAQFQLMIPFPGTPFYDEVVSKGFFDGNRLNYPELTHEELEKMAKQAYRRFYISLPYFIEVCKHPYDLLFSKLKTYIEAIPSVFWRKYIR
ncbi:MAG: B12-binding domain-containing radical SAM protein, partial [Thermodesulfovibrionales bacterium]|nr:B12-binding domain-containing radical SAM protein [Thermodesulfovibrionales bacterium]